MRSSRSGVVLLGLALGLGGCAHDPTGAAVSVKGIWDLVTVDGVAVPATYSLLGYPSTAVKRQLTLGPNGAGFWTDSSTSGLFCNPPTTVGLMCNAGGLAGESWTFADSTVTATREAFLGYVVPVKTFHLQADGSLLKTDDNAIEMYRKE